jgi:hypothetical protein
LLDAVGQGQRELRVSYISEIPVWKSTYRIVFPRDPNGKAIVQGWAVVDNTVGADWDNVQLSLVAGAPQSFIQPLSQPLYMRRPEIPIATNVELTPQTHEAAEGGSPRGITGTVTDPIGAAIADAMVTATAEGTNAALTSRSSGDGSFAIASLAPGLYTLTIAAKGFQRYVERDIAVSAQAGATANATLNVGTASETVEVEAGAIPPTAAPMAAAMKADTNGMFHGRGSGVGSGYGGGIGRGVGGGVYRPSDAISAGDVSTNAFDDFFEYALAQPVTIHKNESAMVPILQQELPAEHVTLWSESDGTPLRAVWLDNQSKLTLDLSSFSVFESGEFAGEGLLDPIHPGERRLLSYAADQAMKIKVVDRTGDQRLSHLSISKGAIVETWMNVAGATYSANNTGDEDRTVLIEHPRHTDTNGWTLDGDLKAAEETPNLYRFRLQVPAHSTQNSRCASAGRSTPPWT